MLDILLRPIIAVPHACGYELRCTMTFTPDEGCIHKRYTVERIISNPRHERR